MGTMVLVPATLPVLLVTVRLAFCTAEPPPTGVKVTVIAVLPPAPTLNGSAGERGPTN